MEVHVIQPTLNEAIFGAKTRPHLLHQTVVMQLANRRTGSAATKTKGFVSGGGKKALAAKGHRPGPFRKHSFAYLGRWRYRIRPDTARLFLSHAALGTA